MPGPLNARIWRARIGCLCLPPRLVLTPLGAVTQQVPGESGGGSDGKSVDLAVDPKSCSPRCQGLSWVTLGWHGLWAVFYFITVRLTIRRGCRFSR